MRGIVTTITTDNTQYVEKGRLLISLDKTEMEIALKTRQDELAQAIRAVIQLFENVKELEACLKMDQAELLRSEQDFSHRQDLIDQEAVSLEDFEHATANLAVALAKVTLTQHKLIAAKAEIDQTTPLTHPIVEMAKDNLRSAYLHLMRCDIYAPATGIIAQRGAQVGNWVNPGDPLMSLIPLDQIWVDANYKETQLKNLRIGQKAIIHADMYGDNVIFHGEVVGQNAGTGSIFSILPPQNATGNWIKIVQRVPVRIRLEPEEVQRHPLWLGLSTEVTIDIHEKEGLVVASEKPASSLYSTDIFADQLEGCDDLIEMIIQANSAPSGDLP